RRRDEGDRGGLRGRGAARRLPRGGCGDLRAPLRLQGRGHPAHHGGRGRPAHAPGQEIARPNGKENTMVSCALYVRLEAKPGKEKEVETFLQGGLSIVQAEPATTAWFALRMGPSTFGIFDAFPDEAGRQAHLSGRVAAALMQKAGELLAKPPAIEKVDVLAAKLPKSPAPRLIRGDSGRAAPSLTRPSGPSPRCSPR